MDFVREKIAEYRARADERRTEGADAVAQLYEKVAGELETSLSEWESQELSTEEAMEFTGYTRAAVNGLKRRGVKLTRATLPKKSTKPRPQLVVTNSGQPQSLAERITSRRMA